MKRIVFLNGKFIAQENAKLSILSSGFLYGQGAFETMRSYDGNIFALDRHLQRLKNSLPLVNINMPYSQKELTQAVNRAFKLNKLNNAYLRLTIWQGEKKANALIFVKDFKGYSAKSYKKGFKGLIVDCRLNESSPLSRIKSTNYLLFYLARKEAQIKGFDEALFLNTKGFLCEGSRSNIFLVKDNKLITPSLNCGCLPGVTRQIVIELAKKFEISVAEKEIIHKDLFKAKEAFLTNSLMEIMPLTKVNNSYINKGRVGEITKLLQFKYKQEIRSLVKP
ncbi:MAG: aminotransferase class IV [Candidatus Omnitrophota bacterium]|nr:aminotransferase class IV [Candidatus Omnitrophota bacterium]